MTKVNVVKDGYKTDFAKMCYVLYVNSKMQNFAEYLGYINTIADAIHKTDRSGSCIIRK